MSESKFTKGSWVGFNNGEWSDCGAWSVDNDEASSYSNVAVNVGNVTICLVVSDSLDDEEMEANAHLIAAAPEMYELLEDYVSFVERGDAEGFNQMFCVVKELLAKARGEL